MLRNMVILVALLSSILYGGGAKGLYGRWHAERSGKNSATLTQEREDITFNPATVHIVMSTTISREGYLIKNLKVIGDGIWKVSGKSLVVVWQQVKIPSVEETRGFGANDINRLAKDLRSRYLDDPIKIYEIELIGASNLTLLDENGKVLSFSRE